MGLLLPFFIHREVQGGMSMNCEQCGSIEKRPGNLILMEVPDEPLRTQIKDWPLYKFCSLEELREWLENVEQL